MTACVNREKERRSLVCSYCHIVTLSHWALKRRRLHEDRHPTSIGYQNRRVICIDQAVGFILEYHTACKVDETRRERRPTRSNMPCHLCTELHGVIGLQLVAPANQLVVNIFLAKWTDATNADDSDTDSHEGRYLTFYLVSAGGEHTQHTAATE
eukprot:1185430-Prorocentrum_minimum.AAC.3